MFLPHVRKPEAAGSAEYSHVNYHDYDTGSPIIIELPVP